MTACGTALPSAMSLECRLLEDKLTCYARVEFFAC